MTALERDRRRRQQIATSATAVSIAFNCGLIAWLGLLSPAVVRLIPEPPPLELTLPTQHTMATVRARAKRPKTRMSEAPATVSNQSFEHRPLYAAPTAPAPVPSSPTVPAGSPGGSPTIGPVPRQGLRTALGCQHADFLQLSADERAACARNFALARASDPVVDPLSGIAPAKLASYDAEWKADHSPQHMAGFGCAIQFGVGKPKAVKLIRALKLGPLPCYIYSPTAAVAPDN